MNGRNLATTAALISGMLIVNNSSSSVAFHCSTTNPKKVMANINIGATGVNSTRFGTSNRFSLDLLHLNLQKLESLRNLEKNWNGYESDPIDNKIIDFAKEFITKLAIQPQVFPTGRGTIQVEKHFDENNFFELELSQEVISIYSRRNNHENEVEVTISEMDKIIEELNA
jgi:hypothetical protein